MATRGLSKRDSYEVAVPPYQTTNKSGVEAIKREIKFVGQKWNMIEAQAGALAAQIPYSARMNMLKARD
jgi:hypothetical protein